MRLRHKHRHNRFPYIVHLDQRRNHLVLRPFKRLAGRHRSFLSQRDNWERLLIALSSAPADHPLRRLEGLICRAARRAIRIRGLRLITLIRRLNLKRALPAPPWLVADPILSEKLFALPFLALLPVTRRRKARGIAWLRALRRCLGTVAGRRWIPRALKASWP